MPAPPRPPRSRAARRFAGSVGVLLAAALAAAQPVDPPKPSDRASAVKLPDGTVVFLTKSPDESNPPVDGVYLSPQEYRALVEQAEQLKKLKDAPRPQAPSECKVAGKVEPRGERAVAVLTLTYSFRTTAPKALVSLGAQKAFPLAAKLDGGKLPVLAAGDDGLTALVAAPGEHTLTLDVEAPVGPRGGKAEVGFEIGLPRAAITTLALAPPDKVKQLTVGARTAADKGGEPKRATVDAAALGKLPLGPAELLEVAWQPPTAAAKAPDVAAEIEAAVRVDEAQVETTATVRLRGPAREWKLVLPPGADVEARRAIPAAPRDPMTEPPFAAASPGLTRPADPTQTGWTFHPPDLGGSDWDLTVTARQPRPMPGDPRSKVPFPVGPLAVPTAGRVTGTVKVYAPPHVRLSFEPAADVRRQDAPPAEEDLAAVFKFTAVGGPESKAPPRGLLTVQAHPARTYTRVQPTYTLRRTETGWRLEVVAAVTPVRKDVDQVEVEVPAGWQSLEAGPLELVEGVEDGENGGAGKRYAVRLIAPQKAPFLLTLSVAYPLPDPANAREATIPLPRFPEADETGAKLTVGVPDGMEVKGTATGTEGTARELKPANPSARPSAAVTAVTGQFEKGVARVQLSWHPYRPELTADLRAEVTLADGQVSVAQTVRFRAADGEAKPIKLRGPAGVVGLRSTRGGLPVDPVGPGEWTLRPPADGAREFTLSVTYALPTAPKSSGRVPVGLLWPVEATRVEATVRVFCGGSARRVARFDGPWRELPPEPVPDRDTLPCLSLAGTGSGAPALPLTLELGEPTDGGAPAAEVERALVQAWQSDDGAVALRGRFRLRRWSPAGVDVELPAGVTADVSVDGKRVDPASLSGEPRVVRVPAPEPRAGRTLLLDVRYMLPATRSGALGELTLTPPRLPGATFRTPARWQVVLPSGVVPLALGRGLQPDVRWGVRRGVPAPVAAAATEELDQWMTDGTDPDADGEPTASGAPSGDALTASQPVLGPVKLYRFSRVRFAAVCSLAALVLGLAVSRLRPRLIGPVLGVVGVIAAVLAAGWPQPAAQAAAAALPGVIGLAVVLGGLAAVRWYYRWQVTHLPGFTRVPTTLAPSTPGSAAPAGPRSSQTGSGVVALDGTTGSHPQPAPSGS